MKPFSRVSLAIYGFYLALAALITFPLIFNLSTQFIGHSTGDAYEMGHHIWWFKYALQHGQPIFWQTLSGYPDGFSGISLWSNPLQFFPMWLFTFVMPVASAYNLTVLLTMALNGWAMCLVMWQWLGEDQDRICAPALVAGVIYMAFPTMQGHLFGGHAGLLVAWGAPLYIYALFKLVETLTWRWFMLAVLFFLIVPSGHTLQLFYVLMPLTGLFIIGRLVQRDWYGAEQALLVSIVGSVILLIFLIPVFGETFADDTYTGDKGYVRFSIDLLGIITPSFGHHFFGQFNTTGRVLGVNLPEGFSYFGIAAALLTLIAILSRRAARWWLLVAAAAWILALGPVFKLFDAPLVIDIDGYPTTITPPWAFFYNLPGFSLARTPGRFTFTLALAAAVLAGYGSQAIWSYLRGGIRARVLLVALAAFAMWEYQAFFPQPTVPADVPQAIVDLQTDNEVRAVMDLPWGNLLASKQGMYVQTWHQKPVVAGQVTRRTPVSAAKLTILENTLDAALLDNAGVDVLLLHKAYADSTLDQRLRDEIGAPYFEDERFALFSVPDPDEGLMVTPLLAPEQTISSRSDSYIFTPAPGWMDLSGSVKADNRAVTLYLNGRPVHQWTVTGKSTFTVPLPLDYRGYHTVTLALEPPCPVFYDATLSCQTLQLADLTLTPLSAGPLYEPVNMSKGVTLAGAYLPQDAITETILPVRLWWTFDEAIRAEDIRFIKVLDANGVQVAALDTAPGAQQPGSELFERLDLDVTGLSGTYAVYVGWYSLPDVQRFPVLSDVEGAQDSLILVGRVTVQP